VVPLRRRVKGRGGEGTAVIETMRCLSDDPPGDGAPLLDRLFASECAHRGGVPARAVAVKLAPAIREAQWRTAEGWEADVPHAAELGQAISTSAAMGSDPPQEWIEKLTTTVSELTGRRTRLRLDSDPVLLAAVVRGYGTARQVLPAGVVESAEALLARRPAPSEAAEMAEALARHEDQHELSGDFATAAFAASVPLDAVCAASRWWLAERWLPIRGRSLGVDPELVRQARLVVLSTRVHGDVRARAMALEAAARNADRLVVDTVEELAAAGASSSKRRTTEVYLWRASSSVAATLFAMANIDPLVAWIDRVTGIATPSALVFQAIFGLGCAVIAFAVVKLVVGLVKLHKDVEMRGFDSAVELFIPLIAALAGAILHQG